CTSWPVLTKVRSRSTRGAIQVKSLSTLASRGTGKASVPVRLPLDSSRRAHGTNTTSPSSFTSCRTALTSSTANPGLASSSWATGGTALVKTLRCSAPLTGYDPRTRRQSATTGRAILPSNTVMVVTCLSLPTCLSFCERTLLCYRADEEDHGQGWQCERQGIGSAMVWHGRCLHASEVAIAVPVVIPGI